MKEFRRIVAFVFMGFVLVYGMFHILYEKAMMNEYQERYVVMNRITDRIKKELCQDESINVSSLWSEERGKWENTYGNENIPADINFLPLSDFQSQNLSVIETGQESYLWDICKEDGKLIGFIEYKYEDYFVAGSRRIVSAALITCFFCVMAMLWYGYIRILKPLHEWKEYPEKLSKGITNEKLPETKHRFFGKFIWGMNMLNDTLSYNKKRVHKLEYERQTLLTSIAHGIKTPVANIKLYANAIETGLYHDANHGNLEDVAIAKKIEKNATDIETLVTKMLETASTSLCDYEPQIDLFYLKELAEQIEQEFANRMKIKRIAYKIECVGNPMINSDKEGLFHILSQFIENAMKYGDGTGLTITMEKQDEDYFFSVKNKGELLPEQEIPFIFKSFWRGSNAKQAEGSGIGLFVAKEMAKKLGGDIYVKRFEETSEMEFVIYLC